jgi:uncharacterized repeat protein (TIGR03803 family)
MVYFQKFSRPALLAAASALALFAAGDYAQAKGGKETVLYSFTGGADGATPHAGLVLDKAGNLYGATQDGGVNEGCFYGVGCGVIFRLAPDNSETPLYTFTQSAFGDGILPEADLLGTKNGTLYGTTAGGGDSSCGGGCGTVFSLSSRGRHTVLHAFNGDDGEFPQAGLVRDEAGNFYSTTYESLSGAGAVFKVSPDGAITVLYQFTGGGDGASPVDRLTIDKAGNLYGATLSGGANNNGVVFKLTPDSQFTVLHALTGNDGASPAGGLILDEDGNLYGTASSGGASGLGVVFRLAPDGTETVLHNFTGGADGASPMAALLMTKSGNLYGTTLNGGGSANCTNGCGTVFEIKPDGRETVVHAFLGGSDGSNPQGVLIAGGKKVLYGTTGGGGAYGYGTVFKVAS